MYHTEIEECRQERQISVGSWSILRIALKHSIESRSKPRAKVAGRIERGTEER